MPLDRTHITRASHITLPLYVFVNAGFGLALVLEPVRELLGVPAYRTLHAMFGIRVWGWLFVGAAVVQLAAILRGRRDPYMYALGLGMILGGLLTVSLAVGAIKGTNPWTAPWFPLFYTGGCLASLVSLAAREHS